MTSLREQVNSEIESTKQKYTNLHMRKMYFNHCPASGSFANIDLNTMKLELNPKRNQANSFILFHLMLEHTEAKSILAKYITLDNWAGFKELMDSHVEFMTTYRQMHVDQAARKIA